MDDGVIIWNTREPLRGRSPDEFEAELKRRLAGRVQAAYLFGSYGRPEFGRDSDVDLMLVVETEKPFLDRYQDFGDIRDLAADMDLLVYTPQEFADLTKEPSPGFWTSAVESMKRVL
jgi:predicted nucleotidyltransferase